MNITKRELTGEQGEIILDIAEREFPDLFIRFGQGKWNEREFIWIHKRDEKGVPNLILEIHWFEFCITYLSEYKEICNIIGYG